MYLVIGIVLAFIVSFWKDKCHFGRIIEVCGIQYYFYYPSFQVIFIYPTFFIKMDTRMFS
ncbi:Uncharacterised protein [Streptococcus pneumoniae]|nr:Uncharacterised protein [Streptococcus pneumoniae]VOV49465.1 Uncharacterised protein [Streptococcus pneumoniae]